MIGGRGRYDNGSPYQPDRMTEAEAAAELHGTGPNPPYPCPRIDTEGCETYFWWQGSRAHVAHMRDEHGVTVPEVTHDH
jgi:hypothetical protein